MMGADYGKQIDETWSWYLEKLRYGLFEEILEDRVRYGLLRQFLDDSFERNSKKYVDKILFISIPKSIKCELQIIHEFLSEFLQTGHLQDIVIQKLDSGSSVSASNPDGETHYLLIDTISTYDNNDFSTNRGEQLQVAQMIRRESLDSVEDLESRSIEINFKPKVLHEEDKKDFNANSWNTKYQSNNDSALNTPHGSELESISSCKVGRSNENSRYSTDGCMLTQVNARDMSERFGSDVPINSAEGSTTSFDAATYSSYADSIVSSEMSQISILPTTSVENETGAYKLILQSVLIKDKISNEISTAIRQYSGDVNEADEMDDWLLYDSKFSMNNLELLTLQSLSETTKTLPKVFFYSVVPVESNGNYTKNGTSAFKQTSLEVHSVTSSEIPISVNLRKIISKTYSVSGTEDESSINAEPQPYYVDDLQSENDSDDDSLPEQSIPEMYIPTKMHTNTTLAHKSMRTLTNTGDSITANDSKNNNISEMTTRENEELLKVLTLTATEQTDTDLLKYSTSITTMNSVEKTKSQALSALVKRIGSKSSTDDSHNHLQKLKSQIQKKGPVHKKHSHADPNHNAKCVIS